MEGRLEVKKVIPSYPLDTFKTSTDADDCFLNIETIIASPTTTSAAATTKTKKTAIWPSI